MRSSRSSRAAAHSSASAPPGRDVPIAGVVRQRRRGGSDRGRWLRGCRRCASCPAGSSHRAPWRQTYNVAYNTFNRWTAADGTWPGQSLNLIVPGGNVVVAMGEKIGLLMPETAESGPQSGLAGITSGVAGGSSTTGAAWRSPQEEGCKSARCA